MSWYRVDSKQAAIFLSVHVQPNAKFPGIAGLYGDAVKIRLNTPPVDGKANKALLTFLADCFSVPVRQVSLESGQSCRQKQVKIEGVAVLPHCLKALVDDAL